MNKFATISHTPGDEVIRQMLAVRWPAIYRDHLRHPQAGPKTKEQTERDIKVTLKQYAVIVQAAQHAPAPYFAEPVAEVRSQQSDRHPKHITKYIVPLLDLPEGTKLFTQANDERLNVAIEALTKIAAIEDELHGGDWDEIEEARDIANAALTQLKGN